MDENKLLDIIKKWIKLRNKELKYNEIDILNLLEYIIFINDWKMLNDILKYLLDNKINIWMILKKLI